MTKEQKEIKRLRITAQQYAMILMTNNDMTMEYAIKAGIGIAPEFVQIFDQEWDIRATSQTSFQGDPKETE